jgi:hypothetical protein
VDEEADDPPPPGCYARFPWFCSLRMFLALVGRHEERTRAFVALGLSIF